MTTPTQSKYTQQFLGNLNSKEVHDVRNEKPQCQLDEIIKADHGVRFIPDTLEQAHREGYDNCHHCIGNSRR